LSSVGITGEITSISALQQSFIYNQVNIGKKDFSSYKLRSDWEKQKSVRKLKKVKIQEYLFPHMYSQFGVMNSPVYVRFKAKTKSGKLLVFYILHMEGNKYPPENSLCDIYYEIGSARTEDMSFFFTNAKVVDAIFLY
jgi:hypothetical protein